jgi:phosphate transport system protein
MAEKFHGELQQLKQETLEMAQFARDMLNSSVYALISEDPVAAGRVLEGKNLIREKTTSLEERAFQLIALNQPMAKDMRVIACTLKIITSSERIWRYGKDIANMVKHLQDQPSFGLPLPIPHTVDQVVMMIDDALEAYERENLHHISDLSSSDDTVDSL